VIWPFHNEPAERAAVLFGHEHRICTVHRDADDRPYVVICDRFIRLDESNGYDREIVWLKRRPTVSAGEKP